MSYLDGTLILMSPELIHDRYGRRLAMVIDEVTEALGIFVEGIATTTLRRKRMGRPRGAARSPITASTSVRTRVRMHRRDVLDLEVDPPPDLAIEVDYKADSAKALKLYARLGVPEVWRYKPQFARTLVRPTRRERPTIRSTEPGPAKVDPGAGAPRPGQDR